MAGFGFVVSANWDQLEANANRLPTREWKVKDQRLPNRVYTEYNSKEDAADMYETLRHYGLVAFKNWLD